MFDSIKIRQRLPNGTEFFEPLIDTKNYSIATNTFMIGGGDGYTHQNVVKGLVISATNVYEWEAVRAYMVNVMNATTPTPPYEHHAL